MSSPMSSKPSSSRSSKFIRQVIAPIYAFGAVTLATLATNSHATVVVFQTSQGNFQVNLYDQSTPATVANFLAYVEDGSYVDSLIHRSISNFIVQGGGFSFDGAFPLSPVATKGAVNNEPVWSNVSATIAMAKLGDQPNSATSQWFFNLNDNSSNLDLQNGGFTAFGQVIGDGMTVVNKIAALTTCSDIPMVNYDAAQCSQGSVPGIDNFVTIYSVEIVDSSANTADSLTKVANTLRIAETPVTPARPATESGGGSLAWLSLLSLGLLSLRRKWGY